ncbi:MAG: hypothetical protein HY841_04385 [Bacteroidetes bacterium]|nr:hypothetical protein [Bacteroidota bacterium]
MKVFKKYFSLFLLALFLCPLIEKSIHDFTHKNTFSCKGTDKHFHHAHPACPICEFTIPVLTVPVDENPNFSIFAFSDFTLPHDETPVISSTDYFVSLRAPPYLV